MSDQIRDAFEAWYIQRQRSRGYGEMLTGAEFLRRMPNGRYMSLGLEDAFAAYQASRLAALEEAAKACEQNKLLSGGNGPNFSFGWATAIECSAEAIRLLANPTTERPAAPKEPS